MTKAKIKEEIAKRELARRYFYDFLRYSVHGWKDTRFARYLAERVQTFIEDDTGHAYDILVIETPPQHGKSMTVTESLPAWYIGRHPESRVIALSYNDTLAARFLRRNRQKLSECGEHLFGIEVGDIDRATDLELTAGGSIISRGIMGGITGSPGDLILIDDPIKNREEADSEAYREKLWDEWMNSVHTRLSAGAKVILIMTPWHDDDLAARMLRTEKNATLVRLPVEAEEGDPLGRDIGEPLCPELGKDAAWLADFKRAYISDAQGGQRAWQALFQCSPRIEGGNLIQRSWWRYYKDIPKMGLQVISVDATFKDGADNDFVAISVWQRTETDFYLLYMLNAHLNFPDTVGALRTVKGMYPTAGAVLIEDKANGSAIIQTLQKEMFCIPVQPKGGKVARANAVSPAIESGHVYLPEVAPWLSDFLDQCTSFPNGAHDDMVDSMTQALSYLMPGSGVLEPEPSEEEQNAEAWQQKEEEVFNSSDVFNPWESEFSKRSYM